MKKIIISLMCLIIMCSSYKGTGQTVSWPYYVSFPPNTQFCQQSPWQLVFNDEFNGNALDTTKWSSFTPCVPSYTDDCEGSRLGSSGRPNNYKDDNVFVSNGTCKIISRYDPNTWQCPSCTPAQAHTQDFSSGEIQTKQNDKYMYGRFEARIKMPTWNANHTTFWTWADDNSSEIDIVEDYDHGGSAGRYQQTALHDWLHGIHSNWPIYGIPGYLADEWHVYACEYDSNFVNYYLDGLLINSQGKWDDVSGSNYTNCQSPSVPTWLGVRRSFPLDGTKYNVMITLDKDATTSGTLPPDTLEIDYVRIYQRHPELDGHKNIENRSIIGPNTICDWTQTYTYTAINFGPHLTWTTSENIKIVSETATTITVRFASGTNGDAWIKADDGNGFLPLFYFPIFIGPPLCVNVDDFCIYNPIIFNNSAPCYATYDSTTGLWKHNLMSEELEANTTYDFYLASGDSTQHTTYVTLSSDNGANHYFWGSIFYSNAQSLSYTVVETNACSSTVCQGDILQRPVRNTTGIPNTTTTETKIYPNPVTDELYVSLGSKYSNKPVSVRVMNMLGQVMSRQIVNTGTLFKIDTKSYTPGMYILKLNEDEYKFTKE